MRQAAFLRGINVGTARRVAMADVVAAVEGVGYTDVSTLLVSGNVCYSTQATPAEAARALATALEKALGIVSPVLVRTKDQLAEVAAACPFPDAQGDGSKLFVGFMAAAPSTQKLAALDPEGFLPERWQVVQTGTWEVWQHAPDGLSGGRLWKKSWDDRLGTVVTARNWNTLAKVRARL